MALRNFAKFIGKRPCQSLSFDKIVGLRQVKKKALAQVFSCGFCEIFKNGFLLEHLLVTVLIFSMCASSTSVNTFLVNAPILYPLKTPENLWVFLVFSGAMKQEHWPEIG